MGLATLYDFKLAFEDLGEKIEMGLKPKKSKGFCRSKKGLQSS